LLGRTRMGGCGSSCNRRRPRRKARSAQQRRRRSSGYGAIRRAEERRQGAHGNAASGGAYHRGDEGGRGGPATPCSAPVLVLEPGDVGLGNHKATATGRHRAAAPTPLTGNEQHHEQVTSSSLGQFSGNAGSRTARGPAVGYGTIYLTGIDAKWQGRRGLPRAGGSGRPKAGLALCGETFNLHRSHIRGDGRILCECDCRLRFGLL